MTQKATPSSIDYAAVGMSMTDIRRTIVKAFIDAVTKGRAPKAHMVWGPPGVGKTFTIYAAAKEIASITQRTVRVIPQLTSCLEPADITGIPTPIEVQGFGKYTEYLAPKWAWECSKEYEAWKKEQDPKYVADSVLLFWDDIVATHTQTLNALLKGVHEGMWGGMNQRDNVMNLAAGNRVEDNAGAVEMTSALGSRFHHLYANPLAKDWIKWAVDEGNIHPFVIGFIRQCPDMLNEFNAEVASRSEKAFACQRTWHMVSDLVWDTGNIEQDDLFGRRVIGTVGRGTATNFLGFMRNTASVVPPEEIVKDPRNARVPTAKQLDVLYATISSLEYYLKNNPKYWGQVAQYALRKELIPDVGVVLAINVAAATNKLPAGERAKAHGSDLWLEILERYEEMFAYTT